MQITSAQKNTSTPKGKWVEVILHALLGKCHVYSNPSTSTHLLHPLYNEDDRRRRKEARERGPPKRIEKRRQYYLELQL